MPKINTTEISKGTGDSGLETVRKIKRIIIDVSDPENQFALINYDEVDKSPNGKIVIGETSQFDKRYTQKDASPQLIQVAQLLIDKVALTLKENDKLPIGCPDDVDITDVVVTE